MEKSVINLRKALPDIDRTAAEKLVAIAYGRQSFTDHSQLEGKVIIPLLSEDPDRPGAHLRSDSLNMITNLGFDLNLGAYATHANQIVSYMLGFDSLKTLDQGTMPDILDIHSADQSVLEKSEAYNGFPSYSRILLGRFHSSHTLLMADDQVASTRLIENELTLTDLAGHRVIIISDEAHDFSYLRSCVNFVRGYYVGENIPAITTTLSKSPEERLQLFITKQSVANNYPALLTQISDVLGNSPAGIILNGLNIKPDDALLKTLAQLSSKQYNVTFAQQKNIESLWPLAHYHMLLPISGKTRHYVESIDDNLNELMAALNDNDIQDTISVGFHNHETGENSLQHYPIIPQTMMDHPPTFMERLTSRLVTGKVVS